MRTKHEQWFKFDKLPNLPDPRIDLIRSSALSIKRSPEHVQICLTASRDDSVQV